MEEQITISKKEYETLLEKAKKLDAIENKSSAGGKKSWAKLTPEQRSERARKAGLAAAKKRWGENSVKKKD